MGKLSDQSVCTEYVTAFSRPWDLRLPGIPFTLFSLRKGAEEETDRATIMAIEESIP